MSEPTVQSESEDTPARERDGLDRAQRGGAKGYEGDDQAEVRGYGQHAYEDVPTTPKEERKASKRWEGGEFPEDAAEDDTAGSASSAAAGSSQDEEGVSNSTSTTQTSSPSAGNRGQ